MANIPNVTKFRNAYNLWQEHIEADIEHYAFNPGDCVVLRGLSNISMNGKEGVISNFIPKKLRYDVTLVGQRDAISIKPVNLELLPCAITDLKTNAKIQIRNQFFQVGMKYSGTIQIPGGAFEMDESLQDSRQLYELTVVEHIDEHTVCDDGTIADKASTSILARHVAYGDEQYVFINISNIDTGEGLHDLESTSFSISYADGETICNGQWIPSEGVFSGAVKQLVNSVDQIYHKNDPVTHTFSLYPCVSVAAVDRPLRMCVNNHQAAIYQSLLQSLEFFCCLWRSGSDSEKQMLNTLFDVPWRELFKLSVSEAERVCALHRHRASVLDKLKFNSPLERDDILKRLADDGYTNVSAHARGDAVCQAVMDVGRVWYLMCNLRESNAKLQSEREVGIYCSGTRVNQSCAAFSSALARCLNRLTATTTSKFKCAFVGENNDECCPICMISLSDIGSAKEETTQFASVLLPCNHNFHNDCIQEWLHNHTECPICRAKLTENCEESR